MENEKIILDKEGYEKLLNSIDDLKEQLQRIVIGRKEANDLWDNHGGSTPDLEEIDRNELRIKNEIDNIEQELEHAIIIEKHNNNGMIDIGDVIVVEINMGLDPEEMTIKLVASHSDLNTEINEVSINSPLGKAIYEKQVGQQVSYQVGTSEVSVLIKEKLDLTKEKQNPVKTRK